MRMSHHDHPCQLVAASWRRKGLAEIAEKRKKKKTVSDGQHLSSHLPILLGRQWMENKAKRGTTAECVWGRVAEGQAGVGETGRTGNRWCVIVSPWTTIGRNEKQTAASSPTHCHVNNGLIGTVRTSLYHCNNTDVWGGGNSLTLEMTFVLVQERSSKCFSWQLEAVNSCVS